MSKQSSGTEAFEDRKRREKNRGAALIEAKNLYKEFHIKGSRKKVHAVSGVSFRIHEGETLALVGESGCGKSTLGRTVIGLLEADRGEVLYRGEDIARLKKEERLAVRKQMQIIFQDPYASLNPRMTVKNIIAEPIVTHHKGIGAKQVQETVIGLLHQVGISPEFLNRYPHQFSGGQRQRIGIARAIALRPELIVCDEPVSALDVSIQSQILNLLKDIQKEYKQAYLFISHDLSAVHFIADRVCVMFLGKICEIGDTESIYRRPKHPYTRLLLDSIPKPDPRCRSLDRIEAGGEMPSPIAPPSGCRFHPRCRYATELCRKEEPQMREFQGRQIACHHPLQ